MTKKLLGMSGVAIVIAACTAAPPEERVEQTADALTDGYAGCWSDAPARAFPHYVGASDRMTPAQCVAECFGYRYAAVEWFTECFCGNVLAYEQRPDAECNTPCAGDPSERCGGSWRASVYRAHGYAGPVGVPTPSVPSGGSLRPGESRRSAGGNHTLVYQGDGNLVVYASSGAAVWATNTFGAPGEVAMQGDGNLVVYDANRAPVWSSGTAGHGGGFLVVDDQDRLALVARDGVEYWIAH